MYQQPLDHGRNLNERVRLFDGMGLVHKNVRDIPHPPVWRHTAATASCTTHSSQDNSEMPSSSDIGGVV